MSQKSSATQEHTRADNLVVAKITSCYGIKGWLKVQSYTEEQEGFLEFERWQVNKRGTLEAIEFDQAKTHGKGLIVHIKGVDDRTSAEAYTGLEVSVPSGALPALGEGDYYWRELEGLQVWCPDNRDEAPSTEGETGTTQKVLLGEVSYLIETGANDVLVVKPSEGSIDKRERLIPYLPMQTVTAVDLAANTIDVDWFVDEE